jgi:hypothetical protein
VILTATSLFLSYNVSAQETAVKGKAAKVVKKAKETKAEVKTEATKAVGAKGEGAGMKFDNETLDYGTIEQNADGKREFVFVNNGTKPLIITNATGSCGCTVPSYPKEPILPGAKASIGVKYDTSRVGPFTKTVTLTSNAEGMASKVLTIKGTVNAAPEPKSPITTKPASTVTKS